MKTKQMLFSLLTLILSATSMQAETVPNVQYLDFKCVEEKCSFGYYIWDISSSPEFPEDGNALSLVINGGNSQTRIHVSRLIGSRMTLEIRPIRIEEPTSSRQDGEKPNIMDLSSFRRERDKQRPSLEILSFSVRLDGSEVVSWTKYVSDYVFVTRNFRVYLNTDEQPVGCVWITDNPTKSAIENRYYYNSFPYAYKTTSDLGYSKEGRISSNDKGPVWVALSHLEGWLSPRELVFPTIEELLDQHSFAIATSVEEYIESPSTIWERPYLLPPVLKLKAEFENEETLQTLKSLQRDVSLSRIGRRPDDFRERTVKLLEYYTKVMDEASPLRSVIERNLEIVRKDIARSSSENPESESTRNTEKTRSVPVRKQQDIPAEPVEHDGSGK